MCAGCIEFAETVCARRDLLTACAACARGRRKCNAEGVAKGRKSSKGMQAIVLRLTILLTTEWIVIERFHIASIGKIIVQQGGPSNIVDRTLKTLPRRNNSTGRSSASTPVDGSMSRTTSMGSSAHPYSVPDTSASGSPSSSKSWDSDNDDFTFAGKRVAKRRRITFSRGTPPSVTGLSNVAPPPAIASPLMSVPPLAGDAHPEYQPNASGSRALVPGLRDSAPTVLNTSINFQRKFDVDPTALDGGQPQPTLSATRQSGTAIPSLSARPATTSTDLPQTSALACNARALVIGDLESLNAQMDSVLSTRSGRDIGGFKQALSVAAEYGRALSRRLDYMVARAEVLEDGTAIVETDINRVYGVM